MLLAAGPTAPAAPIADAALRGPKVIGRLGLSTIDLPNGPRDGVYPFPSTTQLLDSLGATNNHLCTTC
jgi:hypothetical protein